MGCIGWLYVACATLWRLEGKGQHTQVRKAGKELIAGRLERIEDERTDRAVFGGCK